MIFCSHSPWKYLYIIYTSLGKVGRSLHEVGRTMIWNQVRPSFICSMWTGCPTSNLDSLRHVKGLYVWRQCTQLRNCACSDLRAWLCEKIFLQNLPHLYSIGGFACFDPVSPTSRPNRWDKRVRVLASAPLMHCILASAASHTYWSVNSNFSIYLSSRNAYVCPTPRKSWAF